jgi:hypothetical protein
MSDIRRIEFTEESVKIGTETYYAGDVKSFPKNEAGEYIRVGWAKCVETGEQGERKPGAQTISVQSVVQQVS